MNFSTLILSSLTMCFSLSCCHPMTGRRFPCAEDITPGHNHHTQLDWRYGSGDMRIQTRNVTSYLMDRWYWKTGYKPEAGMKPRIVITEIDNRTNEYIALDMMRDVIESVAINDGRFTVIVGDSQDEQELDSWMRKMQQDPKYSESSRQQPGQAVAPQFLGKMRLTKAVSSDRHNAYEEYRLTVTLFDIETQLAVDSAWDVLHKKIRY